MKSIDPYLNFKGNSEDAFTFYKSVFGGEFQALIRFGEMPGCDGMPVDDKTKIMHIALPLPTGNMLMATDVVGHEPIPYVEGNNVSLSLNMSSLDEARNYYDALSKGGNAVVPFGPASWGGYFGFLVDAFGINWMINFDENQP